MCQPHVLDIYKDISENYENKIILAPMVRENKLPFRLLASRYGADLVYSEELIDYKVSTCSRIENKALGTIDFIDKRNDIIFRTCEEEKSKLIFQLGSSNSERALKAAKIVEKDVAGIDFNFGCPKSFSLQGGMGAALLEKPELIEEILTTAVTNLNVPITCKMRVLPDLKSTITLAKRIEACGVAAIAVHGRTKDDKPRHGNRDEYIAAIAEALQIPVIANGGSLDIKTHADILKFKESTGASSVMIARAAMKNPSIFNKLGELEDQKVIMKEYIKLAIKYENSVQNSKYTLQALMIRNLNCCEDTVRKFHSSKTIRDMCCAFELDEWYDKMYSKDGNQEREDKLNCNEQTDDNNQEQ